MNHQKQSRKTWLYVGKLESAVLWHLEARAGSVAEEHELRAVILAATELNPDIYSEDYRASYAMIGLWKMVGKGVLVRQIHKFDHGEYASNVLGIGTHGIIALQALAARGRRNPNLSEHRQ